MQRIVTVKSVQIGRAIGHPGLNAKETKGIPDGIFENSAGRDCGSPRERSFRAASPNVGGPRLETPGNRPCCRSAQDRSAVRTDAREGTVSGGKDRAR